MAEAAGSGSKAGKQGSDSKHHENKKLLKTDAKKDAAPGSPKSPTQKKHNKKVSYAGSPGSQENNDVDFVQSCPDFEERKEMAKKFRKRAQSECSNMSRASTDSKGRRKSKGGFSRSLRRAFSLSEDPDMTPAYASYIAM